MAVHSFSISVLILFVVVVMKPALINGRFDRDNAGGYDDEVLESGPAFGSLFRQDYSKLSLRQPPSASCQDLGGVGSLDTICEVASSLNLTRSIFVVGKGYLYILNDVTVNCSFVPGCEIWIRLSGDFSLGENSRIFAGTFGVFAMNADFGSGSVVNTTGLGGDPPEHTSGTPQGVGGAGGGHGGRGAACLVDDKQLPDDVWGGDAYGWSNFDQPKNYGSKGGTTSNEVDYGGGGGGRIAVVATNRIDLPGLLLADGGDASLRGGGGSGGSIYIKARRMIGNGKISASGGNGFGGGGGGRIAAHVHSRHTEPKIFVHGGYSLGCPSNAGAAGTFYDVYTGRLIVDNTNMKTDTDTIIMEFPHHPPLWNTVFIQNFAKAAVPLLWIRVHEHGQISVLDGAILSFGLPHYASSEFEVFAEELLMSNSILKVYGTMRLHVNMLLMWNSQYIVDGQGDTDKHAGTSIIEASRLMVLREFSTIHSNANLEVRGNGFLNLTGLGDCIEAKKLTLSLFHRIDLGPGSVMHGLLENATTGDVTSTFMGCMGGVGRVQGGYGGGTRGYGCFNRTCDDGDTDAASTAGDGVLVTSLENPILSTSVDRSVTADGGKCLCVE